MKCSYGYPYSLFLKSQPSIQYQLYNEMFIWLSLQSIPEITALNPVSTAVPLVFVLAATAVKDAWDDLVSESANVLLCILFLFNSLLSTLI